MKITKVVMVVKEIPEMTRMRKIVGIRVFTDEGIYGDGEVAGIHATWGVFGVLRDLAGMLIGQNPLYHQVIWDMYRLRQSNGRNGGAYWYSAVSAIDIALWDIKSKYYKAPIHELLGGKKTDKLRCYASQLQFGWGSEAKLAYKTEELVENSKRAIDEGYDAIKIDFLIVDEEGKLLDPMAKRGLMEPKVIDMVQRRVEAVREAIGPKVDLMMENHCGTDTQSAMQLAKVIEPYGIFFYEEPQSPVAYNNRALNQKINLPIAHGEHMYGRWEYMPFLMDGSVAVIQPDLGNCGGITETKKVCDLADAFDVSVQIHTCASHLLTQPSAHLEAAIPNFCIHEVHCNTLFAEPRRLTTRCYDPVDGYLEISDELGCGTEWSEEFFNSPHTITFG